MPITKEEMIAFLKENLSVSLKVASQNEGDRSYLNIDITLFLDGDVISTSSDSVSV